MPLLYDIRQLILREVWIDGFALSLQEGTLTSSGVQVKKQVWRSSELDREERQRSRFNRPSLCHRGLEPGYLKSSIELSVELVIILCAIITVRDPCHIRQSFDPLLL